MNTIIIHGTKGSPEGNWFPWLKKELECLNPLPHRVDIPLMPTPEHQNLENWKKVLPIDPDYSVQKYESPPFSVTTNLVGHSCGANFVLHLLEELDFIIDTAIIVSPVIDKINNEEFDLLNSTFLKRDFDWGAIRMHARKIHILHAENDPYVPLEQAEYIYDNLSSALENSNIPRAKVNFEIIEKGGHLNAEAGYTEFPKVLELLN